jgi:hypothetical protein
MRVSILSLLLTACFAENCNQNDLAMWRGNREFTKNFEKIARSSAGSRSKALKLFREKYYPNMTPECAECHADMVGCGGNKCLVYCANGPASLECRQCVLVHCIPGYRTCLGYEGADLPLAPVV